MRVPQAAEGRVEAGDEGETIRTGARADLAALRVAMYTHRDAPQRTLFLVVLSQQSALWSVSAEPRRVLIFDPVPFAGRVGVIPPAMRRMERRSLT